MLLKWQSSGSLNRAGCVYSDISKKLSASVFRVIRLNGGACWSDSEEKIFIFCANKMTTRCNRGFYCRSYCLLNVFRASLCPSSEAQEYYTVVAACGISCCGFSSSWSGMELRVMRPVCRMLQHPTNRTHNPQLHTRPATWKTTAQNTTRSNHCIILLNSWWWA